VLCASSFSRVSLSVYVVTVLDLRRCREEAEEWVAGRLFCFGGFVALVAVMVGLAQATTPDYAISTEHVINIQAIVMSFAHTQRLNLKTGRKNPSPTSCLGVLA
jgi:hypothetical protein